MDHVSGGQCLQHIGVFYAERTARIKVDLDLIAGKLANPIGEPLRVLNFNSGFGSCGVIIVICIEIGMLTPPVGANLFVLCGITKGEVSISQAALAALPFWFAMLGAVALLALFPQIALFLPGSTG